jgi:hypothetical protein
VLAAAAFTALYLGAASIAAIAGGNREFVFYIIVMVLLIAAVLFVHVRVRLSAGLLWALAIWGFLHMAGGLVPVPKSWPINGEIRVLYSWWIIPREGGGGWFKFDHVVHAYGFAVATWLCWASLRGAVRGRAPGLRPTAGLAMLAALAGCGLGAMNEIVEFVATLIAETNVGGYVNTGWDLVSNAAGAFIAAGFIYARGQGRDGATRPRSGAA